MLKTAVIVVAIAVVGWGVAAIATGSPGLGLESGSAKTSADAPAPECLPAAPVASAEVAGLRVSPAPGSVAANPHTTISLLGAAAGQIGALSVEGSQKRPPRRAPRALFAGRRRELPADSPFRPGEHVTVRARSRDRRRGSELHSSASTRRCRRRRSPRSPTRPPRERTCELLHASGGPPAGADRDDSRPRPAAGDILTTNGPARASDGTARSTRGRGGWWVRAAVGGQVAEDLNEQSFEGQRDLTWWKGGCCRSASARAKTSS